jgi:hypothetical protein
MKRVTKFFTISAIMLAFTASVFAQGGVSATATAAATIITPISIVNAADMNFGNIAVNASSGTVVLPADAAPVRTVTGGCSILTANTGTVTSAAFTVSGLAGSSYSISLPAAATTMTGPSLGMTVDTWSSSPTPTGLIGAGGTETLYIGATLNVAASQTAGAYTSAAPFTITVDYN